MICANECCLRDPLVRFESTRISPWKSCWRAQSGKMNECWRLECWIVRTYVALCSQMLILQYTFACTECGGTRRGSRLPPVTGRSGTYLLCAGCDTHSAQLSARSAHTCSAMYISESDPHGCRSSTRPTFLSPGYQHKTLDIRHHSSKGLA